MRDDEITTYAEFDAYYIASNGLVRAKHPDFHIFRFSELGNRVVDHLGPFKTEYYQFAIGSRLKADVAVFDQHMITEDYSVVIFVPGQIIEWRKTGDWDGYVINVKEAFLDFSFISQSLKESIQFLHSHTPLIQSITEPEYHKLSVLYELMYAEHQSMQAENIAVIKNLMQVLLVFLKRMLNNQRAARPGVSASEPTVSLSYFGTASGFKSLVVKNYLASKSVEFYADKLNVTPAFLNKSLKTCFGKTAKDIIREVLLIHSKTLLLNTNIGIKEIAYQLNYTDYSHFVKFFKLNVGVTPAQYRQRQE